MIPFLASLLLAQNFEQRGFLETRATGYVQSAPGDSGQFVNWDLLRYEASYKATPWLKLSLGVDAQVDTHRQVARDWPVDATDRSTQAPAFSFRRFSATIHKGNFTAELGRQFIRWGKADILNPTDRFAPKDYMSSVVDAQFLGVTAARLTYERAGNTVDLVWQPWFTPSRTPLLNQRWGGLPDNAQGIAYRDAGALYPGRGQYGARFNRVATGYEYSLCFFDGNDYLPSFAVAVNPLASPAISFQRTYSPLRLYGGDAAVPLKWLTLKGEAAYYTFPNTSNGAYAIYVIQAERFVKEWTFVGGYAGQITNGTTTNPFEFSPEQGFAKSFVGRAAYTIDANRSFSVDAAIRAAGSFTRFEYTQARGLHWRATVGFAWLRGDPGDFLGQYNRNSYGYLALRYSF